MISVLKESPLFPKFFFKQRVSSKAFAAMGAKKIYEALPEQVTARLFGAQAFAPITQTGLWDGFSSPLFFEPMEVLSGKISVPSPPLFSAPHRVFYEPSVSLWREQIERTRAHIASGRLDKAVLSRVTTLQFEKVIDPWCVLEMLLSTAVNATLFAIQPKAGVTFLGASPEMLYTRNGRSIKTEAIAGTRPLSEPDEVLLTSNKDRGEFCLVKRGIEEALGDHCSHMEWGRDDVLIKTTHVKHFYNQLRARLLDKTSDRQLIEVLHPTPAMGGWPRREALEWIKEIEPHERGLYAAPIGWVCSKSAELAVGIRSALIKENKVHLFSGAGIVLSSNPDKEWDEINAKVRPFTDLLCR